MASLETFDGREMSTLIQQLLDEAPRFEFYQAVRLLELSHTETLRRRLLSNLTEIQYHKVQQLRRTSFQVFRFLVEETLRQQAFFLLQEIQQSKDIETHRKQRIAQYLGRPLISSLLKVLKESLTSVKRKEGKALLQELQKCPPSTLRIVQEIQKILLLLNQRSQSEDEKLEKLRSLKNWLQQKGKLLEWPIEELAELLLWMVDQYFPLEANHPKAKRLTQLLQQEVERFPKVFPPLLALLEEKLYIAQHFLFIPEQRLIQLLRNSRGHLSQEERSLLKLIQGNQLESQQSLLSQTEKLMEGLYPLAETSMASVEGIHFSSMVRFDFAPSNLEQIKRQDSQKFFQMKVNFMGLGGASCVLPEPYKEKAQREESLRAFLDLFNHRLISLSYRVHSRHRLALQSNTPDQSKIAEYLFALLGLRSPSLRNQMEFSDRSLLYYTGILTDQNRSTHGIKQILTHYLGLTVDVEEGIGHWVPLDRSEQTQIGYNGQNQVMGEGAVLGRRVWDQQSMVEFTLGPLTLEQFLMLQPETSEYRALCDLIRFYLGLHPQFRFVLLISQSELPKTQLHQRKKLNSKNAKSKNSFQKLLPRLTRSAWLSTKCSSKLLRISLQAH